MNKEIYFCVDSISFMGLVDSLKEHNLLKLFLGGIFNELLGI